MSKSNSFFATQNDFQQILELLDQYSYTTLSGKKLVLNDFENSDEIIIVFPEYGNITLWPDDIDIKQYAENSPRWKSAMLAKIWQNENPGRKMIDVDNSPTGYLLAPKYRHGFIWTAGALNFPGSKIKESFPDLYKVINKINRYFEKLPLVFDNTKRDTFNPFAEQMCTINVVHKVHAFPDAYNQMKNGRYFADHMTNDFVLKKFFRQLQLRGIRGIRDLRG